MKLKVGDIELDNGLQVGPSGMGARLAEGRAGQSLAAVAPAESANLSPRLIALLTLGMTIGLAVGAWLSGWYGLLWLVPAPVLGGGAALAAARQLRSRERSALRSDDAGVRQSRALRVAALLSTSQRRLSVEQIGGALGWAEEAVVDGLACLVEEGRVDEDLDLDTGEWSYALDRTGRGLEGINRSALPVRDRAELIARAGGSPPSSISPQLELEEENS